jgi:hypothetical protein
MAKTNLLRTKMEYLKVNGVPIIVQTSKERADAFNVARDLRIEIETKARKVVKGFTIRRTK